MVKKDAAYENDKYETCNHFSSCLCIHDSIVKQLVELFKMEFWGLFGFRDLREKLCVSWALSFNKRVRVWACKIRKPHTHVFVPTSHKVFLRNYWNPNKLAIHIDTNLYFLLLIGRNRSIHIYIKLPPNYHHKYSPYCHYETKKSNGV